MTTSLVKMENNNRPGFDLIEQVVLTGDLSKLTPEQRVVYYHEVCKSLGLNPYTRPFEYITLNGKLQFYTRKEATDQLRKLNGISITSMEDKVIDDLYIVTAKAVTNCGRVDSAKGAVNLAGLKGDQKANAIMKAETKAKRRVTLSISGLGFLDESEVETVPDAKKQKVNFETGEILEDKSNVKLLDIQEKQQPITTAQAIELSELLNLCDPKIKESTIKYIFETNKISIIDDLPSNKFTIYKKQIEEKAHEHQEYLKEINVVKPEVE
jgi:hypothetical protein